MNVTPSFVKLPSYDVIYDIPQMHKEHHFGLFISLGYPDKKGSKVK